MADPTFIVTEGDIFQLTIRGQLAGQTTLSVLHYIYGGSERTDGWETYAEILDAVGANITTPAFLFETYLACCSSDWACLDVRVQKIFPARVLYRLVVYGGLVTGTAPSTALPPTCCGSITKRVTEGGPGNQSGRVQVPALPVEWVGNGLLSGDALAAYLNLAVEIDTEYTLTTTGTIFPLVFRRSAPGSSPLVVDTIVQPEVRNQRTRTVGRGI